MSRNTRVDDPDYQPIEDSFSGTVKEDSAEARTELSSAPVDDGSRLWKNRRRMAYISLFALLAVTGALLFLVPETRLIALAPIMDMFYIAMVSIVGAFIGFQTWFNVRRGK